MHKITMEYRRVSTKDQSDSGLGLEAQEHRNRTMLMMIDRGFHEPVDTHSFVDFIDSGVSAGVPFGSRSAGRELMGYVERIKGPDVDLVLVAYSLDRLFRDVDDGRTMLKWFDDRGVKVLLSNEGGNAIDASSAMGRFLITIRLAQGELERGLTSERTVAALGALKARGGQLGEPPYGWRKTSEKARFAADPEEQIVIGKILELAADGLSWRAIAQWLNEAQIPSRDGKLWSHTTVGRVLQRAEETE